MNRSKIWSKLLLTMIKHLIFFKVKEVTTSANQCKQKIAQFSAQLEQYQKAIEIYEEIAKQSLNNNLLKYGVRGHLLNVGICQLCKGDGNTGGEDRDASIDAFNKPGVMQCPNCRKIEKGRWLYAYGCRPYPEFSMDDWTHDEDLYDFSYSESSMWCSFGGFTRLTASFDENLTLKSEINRLTDNSEKLKLQNAKLTEKLRNVQEENDTEDKKRFGDRVALVGPHHDPPTNMTYNQVEEDILNFSEGLRVIGIKPCEKVALFADNSCRCLVADQGYSILTNANQKEKFEADLKKEIKKLQSASYEQALMDARKLIEREMEPDKSFLQRRPRTTTHNGSKGERSQVRD
ncbi:unnamed protein product [Lactuca virosa]|uniref:AMP-dependent synthetase/ligase domain-containing protein n=1 Tax=Lactuca virosa TaxID=75947 RepID=A0AAU9LWV3_9ASTR|nr:unnamed protein product [Lactuca virosa]